MMLLDGSSVDVYTAARRMDVQTLLQIWNNLFKENDFIYKIRAQSQWPDLSRGNYIAGCLITMADHITISVESQTFSFNIFPVVRQRGD